MSDVDDEQIVLLALNQRLDEMKKDLILEREWRTKQTNHFSEIKEMLSSMINQLRPSYFQEQGIRPISSGMEQNTWSNSVLSDAQLNLNLESPKICEVIFQEVQPISVEETPRIDSVVIQDKEIELVEAKGDPDVAEKHLIPVAHQVFDEMPMLGDKKIKLSDAFPKEFEVLLDGTLDQEALPLISGVEKDDLKVFEVCKAETELLKDHVRVLCFDPGGGSMNLVSDSLNIRCCDRELRSEIYLCEVCLSGYVNQSTLHFSKSDQAKVGSGILLFDPGGESLLLGDDSHDVGVALAGRRYWKCTHVDLSDNADMFPVYWTGYGVYQSCFLAFIPQKVKVNLQLKWLVFDTLDIENHSTPEDSANEYGGKVPFDPGGGALSLNQEPITREKNALWVTDEECTDMEELFMSSLFGISVNQSTLHASKSDQAKVGLGIFLFDPGGEALVLDGGSRDLGAELAEKRAGKIAHVELSDNADLTHAHWTGYCVCQSNFFAPMPHKVKKWILENIEAMVMTTMWVFDPGGDDLVLVAGAVDTLLELEYFSQLEVVRHVVRTPVFDPGGYLAEVLLSSQYDLGCCYYLNLARQINEIFEVSWLHVSENYALRMVYRILLGDACPWRELFDDQFCEDPFCEEDGVHDLAKGVHKHSLVGSSSAAHSFGLLDELHKDQLLVLVAEDPFHLVEGSIAIYVCDFGDNHSRVTDKIQQTMCVIRPLWQRQLQLSHWELIGFCFGFHGPIPHLQVCSFF